MLSKKTYVGGKYGKIVVFWVVMGYQPCVRQRDALSLKPTTPWRGHGSGMRQTSVLELPKNHIIFLNTDLTQRPGPFRR